MGLFGFGNKEDEWGVYAERRKVIQPAPLPKPVPTQMLPAKVSTKEEILCEDCKIIKCTKCGKPIDKHPIPIKNKFQTQEDKVTDDIDLNDMIGRERLGS